MIIKMDMLQNHPNYQFVNNDNMTGLNILLFDTLFLFRLSTNGYINKPNISEGNLASSKLYIFELSELNKSGI